MKTSAYGWRGERESSLKWKVLFFFKLENIQMKEKDHSNTRTWMPFFFFLTFLDFLLQTHLGSSTRPIFKPHEITGGRRGMADPRSAGVQQKVHGATASTRLYKKPPMATRLCGQWTQIEANEKWLWGAWPPGGCLSGTQEASSSRLSLFLLNPRSQSLSRWSLSWEVPRIPSALL